MATKNSLRMLIIWFVIGNTQTLSVLAYPSNQLGFLFSLTHMVFYDETVSFRRFSQTGIYPCEIRFRHQGRSARQTVNFSYYSNTLEPSKRDENNRQDGMDFSLVRSEWRYERKMRSCLSDHLEIWAGAGAMSSFVWGEREFQESYSGLYTAESMDINYLIGWIHTACTYQLSSKTKLDAMTGIPVFSLQPRIHNARLSVSDHPTVLRSWSHFHGLQAEIAWSWEHRRWVFQTFYHFDYCRNHDPYLKKRWIDRLGTGVYYAF